MQSTDEPAPAESAPVAAPSGEGVAAIAEDAAAVTEARESAEKPEAPPPESVETLGGGEEIDEMARRRHRIMRQYKIQEVIKRRQILLVQVVKEERGTKGAALTTYLSLAGRYCVLMPNTARGGGVSRKITSATDRKRLKSLIEDLELPDGMGLIVRTAGSERTKVEIKRDCDYLVRLWDTIREQTLKSTAPCLIHEEANLIKRAIRDLYARDIDEVLVEGEDGYKAAKDFMKMLMPSHAKRVQRYKDPGGHLFQRFQVESQLDAIHSPVVPLKSGGSIVLNQTEALVAIDVNSGRATRERHIEETALKTNVEAAEEIARQLRLRDLAGLVVIDFIDMEEGRHNAQVERRLKEAMRHDRARIQLGRISAFGLLELSRQRLRPSLVEASTLLCPHCGGTGHIRSTESTALHVLRAIEEEGAKRKASEVMVHVPSGVALYILNQKRTDLAEIEQRYGFRVHLDQDDALIPPAHRVDRIKLRGADDIGAPVAAVVPPPMDLPEPEPAEAAEDEEEIREEASAERPQRGRGERGERSGRGEPGGPGLRGEGPRGEGPRGEGPRGEGEDRGRRRRRRRRGRRGDEAPLAAEGAPEGTQPQQAGEVPFEVISRNCPWPARHRRRSRASRSFRHRSPLCRPRTSRPTSPISSSGWRSARPKVRSSLCLPPTPLWCMSRQLASRRPMSWDAMPGTVPRAPVRSRRIAPSRHCRRVRLGRWNRKAELPAMACPASLSRRRRAIPTRRSWSLAGRIRAPTSPSAAGGTA